MHLLAARLPLQDDHRIFFALYRPTTASITDAIEHARATRPPLSLASPDLLHDPALYLFHIAHHNDNPLASLSFPGLAVTQSGSHTPASQVASLYSWLLILILSPSIQAHPILLSHFYHAFRAHLISDMVTAAASSSHSRRLRRFKHGFLISQPSAASSDWEYKSISRPLVFCQLQIILQPSHILVHPLLISTPFLDIALSLPLPPGTPITLLPYGTPAYFLATYTGPTAGLIKQFQASLSGLGAGDWDSDATPSFIIGYIKVENKQGEDKGITIIYPSKLCVSTIPGASPARPPLQYIPELPPPLQPSPQVAPTLPSASGVAYQSLSSNSGVGSSAAPSPYPQQHQHQHQQPRRPSIFSSPTSESLHAFRALNLSKTNDLRQVAVEVGGYVDAVARERERERERLRRERDGGGAVGSSPKMSRALPPPPPPGASMSVHADSAQATLHRMQSMNAVAGPSNAAQYSPVVPPLLPAPQMQMQPSHSQSFYPSPPQTVPSHPGLGRATDNLTSPVVENPPPSVVPSTSDAPAAEAGPAASGAPPPPPQQQPMQQQDDAVARFDSYMMDQSAWASAQVGDAYIPMGDMDMGMDFMSMDMSGMDIGGMDMSGMGMGMNLGDMNLSDTFGMNMDMNMMDMGFGLGPPPATNAGNTNTTAKVNPPASVSVSVSVPTSVSASATRTASGAGAGGESSRMDFNDFSDDDDDFSFFDRPAAAPPPPPAPGRSASESHAPAAAHHHHNFGSDFAGMDTSMHNGQIWTPGALLDGFAPTPGPADAHHHGGGSGDLAPPDLMPSSPGSTPADTHSHSAPTTPAAGVHLAYDASVSSVLVKKADSGHSGSSASGNAVPLAPGRFEPIPFASYHRRADGKYFAGKFAALPSPPPDSPRGDTAAIGFSGPAPVALSSSVPSSSAGGSASSSSTNMGYFYHLPPPPSAHAGEGSILPFSSLPTSPGNVGGNGWRLRYNAQTDPRIGVISKLIGVKRKTPASVLHGTRDPPKTAPWVGSCVSTEEWELPHERSEKEEEELDEEDEDDEEEEVGEEADEDDPETPLRSRPTTPPPSYLPLGPTLLHTQFQHAFLLPLSVPLRPPGAAVAPVNLAAGGNAHGGGALPSVPTPVSPAATMGAATERSKSLEMAAAAVAAEVVENPVWAETWRASTVSAKSAASVWSADYKAVALLLKSVPGLEAPVGISDLFDLDTSEEPKPLEPLEAPMISIGKGNAVIQVLPTALRFWEKLGLDPKGGHKDLSAYVIYEDDGGQQRQTLVDTWLANVSSVYQSKHLGKLSFGKSSMCTKDGHLPIRFDVTLRKTLSSFMASLTPPQPTIVVFLVLPLAAMSLSSPILRQILAVATKIFNGHHSIVLSLQFVPEQHLFSAMERSPTAFNCSLDQLCLAVYNRLPVAVDRVRTTTASNADDVSDIRGYFLAPSITLSRPVYNKVSYVRSAHPSLDVLDRYALLHIGYHLTSCGRWIIACGVDQRGEMHEVGVWLTREAGQGDHEGDLEMNEDEYAVKKVWEFGMQLARKANVEWRVVFTRLGVIHEKELRAWTTCLETNVASSRSQPPLHHTVCCVVPNAPWLLLSKPSPSNNIATSPVLPQPTRPSSASSKPNSLFVDASTSTYAIFPRNNIPISIPPSQSDLGLSQTCIAEPPILASMPSSPHPDSYDSHPATPVAHIETNCLLSSLSICHSPTSAYLPHAIPLTPLLNSILLHVPYTSSAATIGMIHIHLLHTVHSTSYTSSLQASALSSARVPDDQSLLADVTHNFHELAVLAKVGYNLDGVGGHKGLPFHLGAVDAMRMALDRELDRSEVGSDP